MRNNTPKTKIYPQRYFARSEGADLREVAAILGALRPEEDRISKFTWTTDKPWVKTPPKRWG